MTGLGEGPSSLVGGSDTLDIIEQESFRNNHVDLLQRMDILHTFRAIQI